VTLARLLVPAVSVVVFAYALVVANDLRKEHRASTPSTWRPRVSQAIKVVIVLTILVSPLKLYMDRVKGQPSSIAHELVKQTEEAVMVASCSSVKRDTIYLKIIHLDYSTDTVEVHASICLTKGHSEAFQRGEYETLFNNEFSATLLEEPRNAEFGKGIRVPELAEHGGPINLGTESLPLSGSVASYPLESLRFAGSWHIGTLSGTVYQGPGSMRYGRRTPQFMESDLAVQVEEAPGVVPVVWHSTPESAGEGKNFEIAAERTGHERLFVAILLFLPLALFVGMLAALRATKGNTEAGLVVGVAAFLIAMLPIRTVLVPAEITGFTLVDYALGCEMATMVAATLAIVWVAAEQRRPAG
jgi:hypothetical protein